MFERPTLPAPVVEFYCMYDDMTPPKPASDTVGGFLPGRAKAYCPPVTAGSGFGWWLYPPADFALKWDGTRTEWSFIDDMGEPTSNWRSLSGGVDIVSERQRSWVARLATIRGDDAATAAYPVGWPWLNADPRSENTIELDLGVIARTSPGWALLVRGVPNWPSRGVQMMDGIIETDWYRSALGNILRIMEPGVHRFFRHIPCACVQPIPNVAFASSTMTSATIVTDPEVLLRDDELFGQLMGTRVGRAAAAGLTGNYRTMMRHAAAERCPWAGHPDLAGVDPGASPDPDAGSDD